MNPGPDNAELRALVCVPNWLGDSIMAMPALCGLKRAHPDTRLTVLVKEKLGDLWRMLPEVDDQILLKDGFGGVLRAASEIRRHGYREAYVLPNSFRSALIPFLAGVPERIGRLGHRPGVLLTHIVDIETKGLHQGQEYMRMLGLDEEEVERNGINLEVPEGVSIEHLVGEASSDLVVGIIPGAARGPSKRWPAERFMEVGQWIGDAAEGRVYVFGSSEEQELGEQVARGIGDHATNLAGKTSVHELICCMKQCKTVICNDSGGMHLAAAAGLPVVAIFGLTDPLKTAPRGAGHRIISKEDVTQQRDIERKSSAAQDVLESIEAETVIEAVADLLHISS